MRKVQTFEVDKNVMNIHVLLALGTNLRLSELLAVRRQDFLPRALHFSDHWSFVIAA